MCLHGIPIVTDALAEAGLPPAQYIDSGIKFTVILSQPAPASVRAPAPRDQVIYDALSGGPSTVADLGARTGLPAYTIRRSLRELRAQGLVEQLGGQGRPTSYQRSTKNR